jgi:hypothetical protein
MIDGMITAIAVVATMALIHNNAVDFESFRSAIWTRTRTVPQCGSAGVDPVLHRWHEAGQPRAGFSRAADEVNLQNGSSSVVTLITSIRCHS